MKNVVKLEEKGRSNSGSDRLPYKKLIKVSYLQKKREKKHVIQNLTFAYA